MKKKKLYKKYKKLKENYEEISDYLTDYITHNNSNERELQYLRDFIHFKNLENEFNYFSENAVEEETDLPFPRLTLK